MAGQLKVDSINADSNLALKIANTAVAFVDSTGLKMSGSNLQFSGGGTLTVAANNAIVNPTITTPTISGQATVNSGSSASSVILNSTNAGGAALNIQNSGTVNALLGGYNSIVGSGNATDVMLSATQGALAFGTGASSTERMKINSNGYVTKPYQVAAYAYANNQVIANATETYVTLTSTGYNQGSAFNTSTHRFTAPVDGKYLVLAQVEIQGSPQQVHCGVYVNGSDNASQGLANPYSQSGNQSGTAEDSTFRSVILNIAAGDYIQLRTYHNSGSSQTINGTRTNMYIYLLG